MARKPLDRSAFRLEFADDGAITDPPLAELYALALTLGDEPDKAWKSSGGASTAPQLELRAAIEGDPEWQPYLDRLAQQRDRNRADPIYGEAIVLIDIMFAESRAKRNRQDMMEAVRMRLQAAQGVARLHEKTLPIPEKGQSEPEKGRPVGKPPSESPQSKRNTDQIRAALLDKGMKSLPVPEEEDA